MRKSAHGRSPRQRRIVVGCGCRGLRAQAPVSPLLLPLLLPSLPDDEPSLLLLPSVEVPEPLSAAPELLPVESLLELVAGGSPVSVGSGLGPVVSGPVLVSASVSEAISVSTAGGIAHSPMHTSSSEHADPNERSKGPTTANALRFMCTDLFERMRATLATARAPTGKPQPGYGRMISSPRPSSMPNGDVVTSVPRSPT
jgi:hypothetical protein